MMSLSCPKLSHTCLKLICWSQFYRSTSIYATNASSRTAQTMVAIALLFRYMRQDWKLSALTDTSILCPALGASWCSYTSWYIGSIDNMVASLFEDGNMFLIMLIFIDLIWSRSGFQISPRYPYTSTWNYWNNGFHNINRKHIHHV